MCDLVWWANFSQVVTGALAVGTIAVYNFRMWSKRRALEEHLRKDKASGSDKGQRSMLHLMARVGLTEEEVLKASFRSGVIKRTLGSDADGRASHILFEYEGNSN
jgi:hypothetical protein